MTPWVGPFAIAAVLLAVAGAAKAASPAATAGALRALGLPGRPVWVRIGGAAEAGLAAAALATGWVPLVVAVGASYLVFAAFVVAALRAGVPVASCGCLGRVDTPPHALHVVGNLLAAGAALATAATGSPAITAVLREQSLAGAPFVLLVGVGVAAATLAMAALPRALTAGVAR